MKTRVYDTSRLDPLVSDLKALSSDTPLRFAVNGEVVPAEAVVTRDESGVLVSLVLPKGGPVTGGIPDASDGTPA